MNYFITIRNILGSNSVIIWLIPAVIILGFILLSSIISKVLLFLLSKIAEKTRTKWDDELIGAFRRPFKVLILLIGFFVAFRFFPYVYRDKTSWDIIVKCFRTGIVLIVAWGLYNFEDINDLIAVSLVKRFDLQVNNVLLPFLSKALRFVTVALAVLVIAQEWNFSISGLLAGLGLGGLAFALAAKDMLSNVFGGAVILLDKPFGIGDWIKANSVEGTIEDITFRSVKIRTFEQAVVTVPNSVLVNQPIINFSRMGKRRVNFKLSLSIESQPGQLKICTDQIKETLLKNDRIDEESVVVVFDSIGANSLDLMVYFYTKTTEWKEYLKIKESVYYAILDILEKAKVKIAVPPAPVLDKKESD